MEDVAMCPLLGLLALALLGAEAPRNAEASQITYDTWMVEMVGLDWRETMGHDLQLVTRQGGATVWTAPMEVVKPLLEKLEATSKDRLLLRAPRVTACSQNVAVISRNEIRKLATKLNRHADGPVDHASAVAYTPDYEEVSSGLRITYAGRKLDQGVLTCVTAEDRRIAAIHKVTMGEMVSGEGRPDAHAARLNATIEVPEMVQGAVSGEWLIPTNGALIVSLGTNTKAGQDGKAEVHERLLIVQAWSAAPADSTIARASLTPNFTFKLPVDAAPVGRVMMPLPAQPAAIANSPSSLDAWGWPVMPKPAQPAAMPIPAMPSRSLPQPLAADGSPVALPPLPELPHPPSSLPGTSDPCASPQAPVLKNKEMKEEPKQDPQAKATSYAKDETPRFVKMELMEPTEAKVWRIPIGGGNLIEISVRGIFRNIGIACPEEAPAPPK
jgi:hypothetical protein